MNKIFLLIALVILSQPVLASNQMFSPAENERVLKMVDNVCGDVWCEGYYNYKFLNFSCDKDSHQCDLNFQFVESIDDERIVYSPVQKCSVSDIFSLSNIVNDDFSLNGDFQDNLSMCFGKLEDAFRSN